MRTPTHLTCRTSPRSTWTSSWACPPRTREAIAISWSTTCSGTLGERRPHAHLLDGTAADADAECARYEAAIAEAGGIDLQILGLGTNGHIGFNEPAPELMARTHRVMLRPETRRSNAGLFGGDPEAVPREALSMGMATILQARRIVLVATGRSKAGCVRRMIEGPLTTMLPASFLQLHREVEVMLDGAAARELNGGSRARPPARRIR